MFLSYLYRSTCTPELVKLFHNCTPSVYKLTVYPACSAAVHAALCLTWLEDRKNQFSQVMADLSSGHVDQASTYCGHIFIGKITCVPPSLRYLCEFYNFQGNQKQGVDCGSLHRVAAQTTLGNSLLSLKNRLM